MHFLIRIGLGILLGWGAVGCQTDYARLPTFSAERKLLQAVVEIPAGTNRVLAYDPGSQEFRPRQRVGTDQRIDFLPFPGNYGFIPGTHTAPTPGDSAGRPLPVLILAESQPTGTVLEVLPIGLVTLEEAGQLEHLVLAVSARPSQQILPAITTWSELRRQYPTAQTILRLWLQQYRRPGEVHVVSWKDEQAAEQQIQAARQ